MCEIIICFLPTDDPPWTSLVYTVVPSLGASNLIMCSQKFSQ